MGSFHAENERGRRVHHRRSDPILKDLKAYPSKAYPREEDKGSQSRKGVEISPISTLSILKRRVSSEVRLQS